MTKTFSACYFIRTVFLGNLLGWVFFGSVAAQNLFPMDSRRAMDKGICRRLTGRTVLCPVFINLPGKIWSRAQKDSVLALAQEAIAYYQCEAEEASVALQMILADSPTASLRAMGNVVPQAADLHRHIRLDTLYTSLKQRHTAENVAFVLVMPNHGRSEAYGTFGELPWGLEFVVYYPYSQGEINVHTDPAVIVHEILHLFGAMDLYYPDSEYSDNRQNYDSNFYIALNLFRNCIMNSNRKPICPYFLPELLPEGGIRNGERLSFIDLITQYLIGWKETYPPEMERLFNMKG